MGKPLVFPYTDRFVLARLVLRQDIDTGHVRRARLQGRHQDVRGVRSGADARDSEPHHVRASQGRIQDRYGHLRGRVHRIENGGRRW